MNEHAQGDRTDTCFQVSMGHNYMRSLHDALVQLGGYVIPGETFIEATQVFVWVEFEELHDASELEQQLADLLNSCSYPEVVCYHDPMFDDEEDLVEMMEA